MKLRLLQGTYYMAEQPVDVLRTVFYMLSFELREADCIDYFFNSRHGCGLHNWPELFYTRAEALKAAAENGFQIEMEPVISTDGAQFGADFAAVPLFRLDNVSGQSGIMPLEAELVLGAPAAPVL